MLDKLKLTSKDEVYSKEVHKAISRVSNDIKGNMDRLYLNSKTYLVDRGIPVVVKTMNKQANISPICIELNPSHFI